jgi:tetratricopeptide (TPR) repeat protein
LLKVEPDVAMARASYPVFRSVTTASLQCQSITNPAIELIVAARRCIAAGRLDEAQRLSAEAVKGAPRHPAALQARARVHYRRGELGAAERLLRQAIGADPAIAELHADLANVLQDRGQLDAAIAAYRRALRLDPASAEAQNDLGTAYGAKGEFAAAIDCYRKAIRLRPDHLVAHGNLGAAHRRTGEITAARRALQRELWLRLKRMLARALPRRAPDMCAEGRELLARGHARFAEEIARHVLERAPGDGAALRLLAEALERQGEREKALMAAADAARAAPRDARAQRQLGRLLAGTGRLDEAVTAFEASRALERSAETLGELAALQIKRGRLEQAEAMAREAVACEPGAARLHCVLGEALARRKALAQAEAQFQRALELDPEHLAAWIRLSELARESGRLDEAEAFAEKALEVAADSAAALVALGSALKGKGRNKQAVEAFQRAIELDPDQIPAYQQLARVLREEDDVKAAERWLRDALARREHDPSLLADLALLLGDQMRYDDAFAAVDQALAKAPQSLGALTCKGMLFDQTGRRAEALEYLCAALRVAPEDDNAHFSLALHFLKHGDYGAGWDEYERRRSLPNFIGRYRDFPFPEWDGSALAGRTLLVYPEQGLGDEIMFGGCIPQLASQARHVVLECDRKLEKLFRRSLPHCTVVPRHRSVANDWVSQLDPRPDVQTPVGSLARHFRRGLADFPAHAGYLRADPDRVAAWRARIDALGPGRTVGLSWRGGVGYTGRLRRSIALETLLPILRLPGLHFVNLQYTDVREELEHLKKRHNITVHHWQEAIDDYDETAALVCAVDEVLTVCTAIVHLSGALGRPATVMVPFGADWRYGAQGEHMPWYPSVRLVRQRRIGEWGAVLEEVGRRLSGR